MYKQSLVGVVTPAYNEEKLIQKTLQTVPNFVDKIYVIDDDSQDQTYNLIQKQASLDPRIIEIRHDKNKGVGGAIVSGFRKAIDDKIDIVVVMAGDNQMDPDYLGNLIEPIINNEAEFTKGNRLEKGFWEGMCKFRLFGNRVLTFLTKIASGYWKIKDSQNGYVAISTTALKKIDFDTLYKRYAFENDLMIKANVARIRMKNVTIPARYGEETSTIKYRGFIVRTSSFLFKSFFWRLWHKYIKRKK